MIPSIRRNSLAVIGLAFAWAIICGNPPAWSATYTWNSSATSTSWNVASNWGGTVPTDADIGLFNSGSYTALPNLTAIATVGGVYETGTAVLTISGSALTLNGATINGNSSTGIEMDPFAAPLMINSTLSLGTAQTWRNNSSSFLTVSAIGNGGHLLTIAGGEDTISGVVSGAGGFTVSGAFVSLNAGNTYTGATNVTSGTLNLSNGLALQNSTVTAGGFVFDQSVAAHAFTLGGLSGSANLALTDNGGNAVALTIGNNNASLTYSGVISGGGGLTKVGAGNLWVSGASIFSGGLNIAAGTLTINGAGGANGPFGNSAINVLSGSELDLNVADSLGYNSGGTLTIFGVVKKLDNQSETLGRPIVMSGGTMTSGTATVATGNGAWNFFNNYIATANGTNNYITGVGAFSLRTSSCNFNLGSNSTLTISVPITQNNNSANTPLNLKGPGLLILSGSNTYGGATSISGGTLQLGNGGITGSLSNSAGSVILDNGALAFSRTSTFTQGADFSPNAISGSGSLIQLGPGPLTLTTANTYTGGTSIRAGTLALGAPGRPGSGNVSISPGGVLDVTAYGGSGYNFSSGVLTAGRTSSFATDVNGNLNVATAAINPFGTLTVGGTLGLSGGTLDYLVGAQIAAAGALALAGTDYVVPAATLSSGNYTLFTYNGGLAGSTANLAMGGTFGANPRQSYMFGISGGTAVTLAVAAQAGNLVWNGASSTWDTVTSQNWFNLSTGTADYFYAGDNVTFNDLGTATNVTISGTVLPSSLTVDNTVVNYTFSGTGSIGGATSLVKNGPGSLTLSGSNAYSGGTFLNAGTINASAVNALGSGPLVQSGGSLALNYAQSVSSVYLSSGLMIVNDPGALGSGTLTISGGSLDNQSGAPITLANNNPQLWNGSFTFLGSYPLNLGSGAVTLSGAPAVFVSVGSLTVDGAISGTGALTKNGPGLLILTGSNTLGGSLTVDGGTLQMPSGSLASPKQTIGNSGTGSFTLSGGTNTVAATLYVGYNAGSIGKYSLSGNGLLTAPDEYIGYSGTGSFTQSGGAHVVDPFYLGYNAGSYGTYSLSGTGLLVADTEYIGVSGSGSFTQSGGTNSVGGLVLAQSAGS